MNTQETTILQLEHMLPGRLRVRFSRPLAHPDRLVAAVKGHEGILSVRYTALSRSLLVLYDPARVQQGEVIVRTALACSLDGNPAPVKVAALVRHRPVSAGAFAAALATVAAGTFRAMGGNAGATGRLEGLSAAMTGLAVLHHGWREVQTQGSFDPEVLSLVYLLTAFVRGEVLVPSLVTWLLTFGRHLGQPSGGTIQVTPVALPAGADATPRYEFVVAGDRDPSPRGRGVRLLQGLLRSMVTGSGPRGLLADLRQIARAHGEVLEGMERLPEGIPLRFAEQR